MIALKPFIHHILAFACAHFCAHLCPPYAIDQSLTSLKLYKRRLLENMPTITTVAVWLVLERDEHIEDANGRPVIDALNMLMLKNRLDQWKKEVRVQGFTPIIYITGSGGATTNIVQCYIPTGVKMRTNPTAYPSTAINVSSRVQTGA